MGRLKTKALDKRRQSEMRKEVRKEKSKVAARCRRGKEGEVFSELTDTLPVNDKVKGTLDKLSIIRLSINYIKTRHIFHETGLSELHIPHEPALISKIPSNEVLDLLYGATIVLAPTSEIVYVTENVEQLLGVYQYDVIGHSLDMFIHSADWNDAEKQIKSQNLTVNFTARFKCTLSSRSRVVNSKPSSYKTLRFSGQRLTVPPGLDADDSLTTNSLADECLILTAMPIEMSSLLAQPLDDMTFTSEHSLDMKFKECDSLVTDLTHYPETFFEGKSLYDFIHPADLTHINAVFKSLYSKEQVVTDPYRFLTFGGGYVRMVTHLSLATDSKTSKPKHALCVHRVISRIEDSNLLMADVQQIHKSNFVKTEAPSPSNQCAASSEPLVNRKPANMNDFAANEEAHEYSDIFDTTASCFVDPDEFDEAAADVFGQHASSADDISQNTVNAFNDIINLQEHDDKNAQGPIDLEALIAKMDNEEVDMTSGLLVDVPELADDMDENFYHRAPYFAMEDFTDLPWIETESYYPSLAQSSPKPADNDSITERRASYRKTDNAFNTPPDQHSISPASFDYGSTPGTSTPGSSSSLHQSSESISGGMVNSPTCTDILDMLDLEQDSPPPLISNTPPVFSPGGKPDMDHSLQDRLSNGLEQSSPPPTNVTQPNAYSDHRYLELHSGEILQSRMYQPHLLSPASAQRQYAQPHRKRKLDQIYSNSVESVGSAGSPAYQHNNQNITHLFHSETPVETGGRGGDRGGGNGYSSLLNDPDKPIQRVPPFCSSVEDSRDHILDELIATLEIPAKKSYVATTASLGGLGTSFQKAATLSIASHKSPGASAILQRGSQPVRLVRKVERTNTMNKDCCGELKGARRNSLLIGLLQQNNT